MVLLRMGIRFPFLNANELTVSTNAKIINTTLFISFKKLKFKTAAKVVLIVQKTLKNIFASIFANLKTLISSVFQRCFINSSNCSAEAFSFAIFLYILCFVVDIVDTALTVNCAILEVPSPIFANKQI